MPSRFISSRSAAGLIATLMLAPIASHAQVTFPDIGYKALGRSTQPLLAGEAAYHVQDAERRRSASVSVTVAFPFDSVQAVVAETGKAWLPRISTPITGIQQDAAITVLVAAGDVARAQTLIADRIATGKLSLEEQALTYLTAVSAFADQVFPDRLPIAESYLAKLDALGDSAATRRYQAHTTLIHTYFQLGRSADIRRLGAQMIALVPKVPFNDRGVIFFDAGIDAYDEYITALASEPHTAELIAQTNAVLTAGTEAPTEWVARDPQYAGNSESFRYSLTEHQTMTSRLGTPGQPLVAQLWLHRDTRDSVMRMDDGKIRVIELANTSCPGCMIALQMVQRLQNKFPAIETAFVTYTYGYWGNRFVQPDEEATLITKFLEERAKITMPAGIWKSTIAVNEDGGRSITSRGVNFDNYPTSKMSVWVIDGRGIIRRAFDGLTTKGEAELIRTVAFLEREAAERRAAATRGAQ